MNNLKTRHNLKTISNPIALKVPQRKPDRDDRPRNMTQWAKIWSGKEKVRMPKHLAFCLREGTVEVTSCVAALPEEEVTQGPQTIRRCHEHFGHSNDLGAKTEHWQWTPCRKCHQASKWLHSVPAELSDQSSAIASSNTWPRKCSIHKERTSTHNNCQYPDIMKTLRSQQSFPWCLKTGAGFSAEKADIIKNNRVCSYS